MGKQTSLSIRLLNGRWLFYISIILWLIATVAWIVTMNRIEISREPSAAAGASNLAQLWWYWLWSGLMWVCMTVWYVRLTRQTACKKMSISSTQFRLTAGLILGIALGLRVSILLLHSPSLSDDIWRYVFDGHTVASSNNPYLVAPADIDTTSEERFAGEHELAKIVNHPDLVTIYLPTSQISFAIITHLIPEKAASQPEASQFWYRTVFTGVDLFVVLLLLFILRSVGRSPWWAVLYGWHPLVMSEIAGSGHQDILGIAFMLLAIWAGHRIASRVHVSTHWPHWWAVFLAFAAAVKPVPLPIGLFVLRKQHWRYWIAPITVGVIVSLVLYAPFTLTYDCLPLQRLMSTVNAFVTTWAFQGSVFGALTYVLPNAAPVRLICMSILGLLTLGIAYRSTDVWSSSRTFLFAVLLLSPIAHPWYLLWPFVLFAVRPSPALWIASLTLPFGYIVLGDVVGWTVPWWSGLLTYIPVYAALVLSLCQLFRRSDR